MDDLIKAALILSPLGIYTFLVICIIIGITLEDKRRGTPGRIEKKFEDWWNRLLVPTQTILVVMPIIATLVTGAAIGIAEG